MLTVLGVNVFPSAIRDVVGSLRPKTSGEIQVVLDKPGPAVAPPVMVEVEYGKEATDLEALKKEIEALLNARLSFRAAVHLVPEGSLPRFEMKAQLIKKLWETQ
jgi:phenylacetate-CoA ligase